MKIDAKLRVLNTLSPAKFQQLVEGYTKLANDFRVTRDDRVKARRRVRLLQLSRVPTRLGEVGVN